MQTANWIAVGVIVLSTVLNAGYFLPIVFRAFFRERRKPAGANTTSMAKRLGRSWLALTVTAAGTCSCSSCPTSRYALAKLMIGR